MPDSEGGSESSEIKAHLIKVTEELARRQLELSRLREERGIIGEKLRLLKTKRCMTVLEFSQLDGKKHSFTDQISVLEKKIGEASAGVERAWERKLELEEILAGHE